MKKKPIDEGKEALKKLKQLKKIKLNHLKKKKQNQLQKKKK